MAVYVAWSAVPCMRGDMAGGAEHHDTRWKLELPFVTLTVHVLQSALHAMMTTAPQMDTAAVQQPRLSAEFSIWP